MYSIEAELTKNNIKYEKLGGISLNESIEIKQLIHLIIFILSNDRKNSFIEILSNLSGIGQGAIDKYFQSLKFDSDIKIPNKITKYLNFLENLINIDIDFNKPLDKKIFKEIKDFYFNELFINIKKQWKRDREQEAINKLNIIFKEIEEQENIHEIFILLENYILGEQKNEKEEEFNITLTTIHSSKGLEWDDVYLFNWDDGSFIRDKKEEAQRLVYVSVSRAKENLVIMSRNNKIFEIDNSFIFNNLNNLFELKEFNGYNNY
jgi:DNA helicase-2/ATP-dependent DNA helicase PcrA